MVRGGQNAHHHSDESDSDWDSLAQPPAVQPPPIQQQAKEVVISPLKLRDAAAVAGNTVKIEKKVVVGRRTKKAQERKKKQPWMWYEPKSILCYYDKRWALPNLVTVWNHDFFHVYVH